MFKRIVFYLQALIGLFISWIYFVEEYKKGSIPKAIELYIYCSYVALLVFSVVILFMVSGSSKKEKRQEYIEVNGIQIEENVFIKIVQDVLNDKKEIEQFNVDFKKQEDGIKIRIEASPKITEDFSFTVFSEKISIELKEKIKSSTSFEKSVHVQFVFSTKIKK